MAVVRRGSGAVLVMNLMTSAALSESPSSPSLSLALLFSQPSFINSK